MVLMKSSILFGLTLFHIWGECCAPKVLSIFFLNVGHVVLNLYLEKNFSYMRTMYMICSGTKLVVENTINILSPLVSLLGDNNYRNVRDFLTS